MIFMPLFNVMESIVKQRLDEMLKSEPDCCRCSKCYNDMMAYALNKLNPMYVNSKTGELYSRLNTVTFQKVVDIDMAIASAIKTVMSYPRHEPIDDYGDPAGEKLSVGDGNSGNSANKSDDDSEPLIAI